MTMPAGVTSIPPRVRTFRERVALCFTHKRQVEQLLLIFTFLVIEMLVEMRAYAALGPVTILMIGLRDMLILLLFAEEEGLVR